MSVIGKIRPSADASIPGRSPVVAGHEIRQSLACESGQAKVEDLDLSVRGEHQVLRLDVPMNHAALKRVLESFGGLLDGLAGERDDIGP